MHGFSPLVEQVITLALVEDFSAGDDITTSALFDAAARSSARLVAKAPLVLAGGPVFVAVMDRVAQLPGAPAHQELDVTFRVSEGTAVDAGEVLATLRGPTVTLLRAERVALNFLQRLSGIATRTRSFAETLGPIAITDTRKTTPGHRELERYAVRLGGGRNHRYNLASGVLIKENHIVAAGGVAQAVSAARAYAPHPLRIEVEVQDLSELRQALDAGADIVMLDNMDLATMQEAVAIVDGSALIEVSGNVTLARAPELAKLGVDFVSSGALTHSITSADISMLFDQ